MLYYFILLLIVLLPSALVLPSLSFRSAIITAISLDAVGEKGQVEVSALTLSQIGQDTKENNKLFSAKADTFARGIELIELRLGRKIKLGHMKYIILSKELAQNDIAPLLDTFIRTNKISNSVSLFISEEKAKDVLTAANELAQSSSYYLSEIISNNYDNAFTKETSIDYFYKGYYSKEGTSTLSYIGSSSTEDEGIPTGPTSQQDQSSGEATGQNTSGGSAGGQSQKTINFNRQNAILKNGKFVRVMDRQEMRGLDWITTDSVTQYLTIENFTDEQNGLFDATITFEVDEKTSRKKVMFIKNVPNIIYNINISFDITEIIEKQGNSTPNTKIHMTDKMNLAITEKIKQEVLFMLQKQRQYKTDAMGLFNFLESQDYYKFHKMLNSLQNKEDFLSYVRINMEVTSKFA